MFQNLASPTETNIFQKKRPHTGTISQNHTSRDSTAAIARRRATDDDNVTGVVVSRTPPLDESFFDDRSSRQPASTLARAKADAMRCDAMTRLRETDQTIDDVRAVNLGVTYAWFNARRPSSTRELKL